ncbi:MAG: SusC/RagA family TonB-linked outer membrane protein [Cyclobacteriaceae bacterium]|nr:MAG: SusC/RagA family TonB-linked outer membrane protein [Cyclobacteriaceae bacterium]
MLSVPPGYDSLVFSYVGYRTQEIPIGQKIIFNIQLHPDIRQLSDVMITAIGIEKENQTIGYAATALQGKEVAHKAESDMVRALAGKVPGVFVTGSNGVPGSSSNIVIRGYSSFQGNNQPLFVVDGIPFDNSSIRTRITDDDWNNPAPFPNRAQDIDPNDIESITILRGAAAAALYGSRAANGVVVITTKSREPGAGEGFEVSYSGSYYLEQINRTLDYQNSYGQGLNGLYGASDFRSFGPSFQSRDSVLNNKRELVPYRSYPGNVDDFFETGHIFENSINVTGGGENTSIVFSGTHFLHNSFIPGSKLDKLNLRIGGDAQLKNGLRIGGNVSYIESNQQSPTTGRFGFSSNLFLVPRNIDLDQNNIRDPNQDQNYFSCVDGRCSEDNPFFSITENPSTFGLNRIFGNINLGYDISEWLTLSYKIGLDKYSQNNELVFAQGSNFARNGAIFNDDLDFSSIESNLLVTFAKSLGKNLQAKIILGNNISRIKTSRISLRGDGIAQLGSRNILHTENIIPHENFLPKTERRLIGLFFDASFSYRDFLFLTITGRNDWSSTLPKENNSFFYPSATLSWIFTKNLDSSPDWWQYSKLRLAVARVGNDASPHLLTTVYNTNPTIPFFRSGFPFRNQSGQSTNDNSGNPQLKPEFTSEWEVGMETALFNNRFFFDFTYYNRTAKDQIFNASVVGSSGFKTKLVNAGKVNNRGIEIALQVKPLMAPGKVTWNLNFNFSRNISKVVSLYEDLRQLPILFAFTAPSAVPGYPYGVLVGGAAARDSEGNLLVNPTNVPGAIPGVPKSATEEDFYIIGDPNPDFLLGAGSEISFKGLTLGFLFDLKKGGDLFAAALGIARGFGVTEITEQNRNGNFVIPGFLADPENYSTADRPLLDENGIKVPNNIYLNATTYYNFTTNNGALAEFNVFDATYLKLRELTLNYQFPEHLLENLFLGSARISLFGRNLWVYTPNMPCCLDPETNELGSGNAQSLQLFYVPNSRRFGMSVNMTF